MARIRTVKPGFWKHEELSGLPAETHMLAVALLNYADDEGYFNANPALVKADCCPLRELSVSVHDSLQHLANIGYVRLARGADGRQYGHIVKFIEHQRVNRPQPSKIKALMAVINDADTNHTQFTEPSPPEGKGMEEEGKVPVGTAAPSSPDKVLFDFGKQVLGPKAGGQITKLKQARGTDGAWRVLKEASEKSDAAEYVAGALRGHARDGPANGRRSLTDTVDDVFDRIEELQRE